MSTRTARSADKALNEKHSKILKELLRLPENKYCADCRQKDPRWASWNLGVFVCIHCSGIHRSMGVHISKVKSVDLDMWNPDQVENMARWGNERANIYWEANLKEEPPSRNRMDAWIRCKYDDKRWAMKGPIPDPSTLGGRKPEETEPTSSAAVENKATPPLPPRAPEPSPLMDLDAFLGRGPTPPATTAPSPAKQPIDFLSAPAAVAATAASTTSPAAPPQQEDKHELLKSSIMALYNKPPPQQPPVSSYQDNMTNYQQQLLGLSNTAQASGTIPSPFAGFSSPVNSPGFPVSSAVSEKKSPTKDPFAGLL